MSVTGHWRRSAIGAGGVALLLPVGLAVGVALTTALGGEGTLRALGQVFAGPSTPVARGASFAPGLESTRAVPAIPAARRRASSRSATRGPAAGRPPAARGPSTSGAPVRRPRTPPRRRPSRRPSAPAPSAPSSGAGGTAPSAPPTSPPSAGPLHDAGQAAADTVKALPAPVGPVAGDAVQTVVDLVP